MSLLLGWGLRGFWAGWLAGEKRDLAKSGTIVGLFSENGLLWARCQHVTGCVEPPPRVLSFNELLWARHCNWWSIWGRSDSFGPKLFGEQRRDSTRLSEEWLNDWTWTSVVMIVKCEERWREIQLEWNGIISIHRCVIALEWLLVDLSVECRLTMCGVKVFREEQRREEKKQTDRGGGRLEWNGWWLWNERNWGLLQNCSLLIEDLQLNCSH